ncbi:MAG: hypothetical protein H0X29_04500 [Parachlamydiaceae bacterium]|nr:hypothetical protein [Parachlamydiaceae bacterium]
MSTELVAPVVESLEQKTRPESSMHKIVEIMKKKPLSELSLILCSGKRQQAGYIKRSCGDWSSCHVKTVVHPKSIWKIPDGDIIVFENPPKEISKDWESLVERDLYQVICKSRDGLKDYVKFTGVKEALSVPSQVFLEVFPQESAQSWYSSAEMETLYLKC